MTKIAQKQLGLKIKKIYLNNNKIDVKSLLKNHNEFITKNKMILTLQKRFKSERHNIFY